MKYRPRFSILALAVIIVFTAHYIGTRDRASASRLQADDLSFSRYETKITPPVKGIYQGAFVNFGGVEDEVRVKKIIDFEKMIGKKIVWAMFSNNWGREGITFPEENVLTIYRLGIVPFIRMMPRDDFQAGERDPVFTLQRIIEGKFDDELLRWAHDAKRVHIPIIVEFGPEMNGDWFPWSGILNGGEKKDGYGHRQSADGPERFRDAYRHIINLFRKEGVQNITWAFHVFPPEEKSESNALLKKWNNIKNYYPGDNYIDWIGLSVYGAVEPNSEWKSFTDIMDIAYPIITEISADKPLAVFEFGVAEYPQLGNKTEWIKNALESLESGRYPRIKAISYWDEIWKDDSSDKVIDLRINSSIKSSEIYREILNSSYFVSQAEFQSGREIKLSKMM